LPLRETRQQESAFCGENGAPFNEWRCVDLELIRDMVVIILTA
jgi:hypothetical protein